jgi:predicted CXXCH cytochrome family protein
MILKKLNKSILLITILPIISFGQMDEFHLNFEENCKYCHVLGSEGSESKELVWQENDHNITYIPYSSPTIDAEISQPLGSSKLCLSCHDGTFAFDDTGSHVLTSNQSFGTDLRGSHPVSFKYDSFLAMKDNELHDPLSSPSGLGGTIHSDMLINGNLECISCHDIHGMMGIENYLVKSNYKSNLCLTCHNK